MHNFVISTVETAVNLVDGLRAFVILPDWAGLTVLLRPSVIMPSLLFMGLAWAVKVSLLGTHEELAL